MADWISQNSKNYTEGIIMRALKVFIIAIALLFTGCASRSDIPLVSSNTAPSPVRQIPLKIALDLPDASYLQVKTTGSLTETIPAGQYLRNNSRKFFSYAFEDVQQVSGRPYPTNVDAVLIPKIEDYKFDGEQVALGFGLKFIANVSLKGTLMDMNNMIIWEGIVRASKTSRAVISPIIPVAQLKGEAMGDAVGEAFRMLTEEISMSGEIKNYAASRASAKPVAQTYQTPQPAAYQSKGWLGIEVGDTAADTVNTRRLKLMGGASVVNVIPNSPAYRAGIIKGLLIVSVNGERVASAKHFAQMVGEKKSGDVIELEMLNDGKNVSRSIILGRAPAEYTAESPAPAPYVAPVVQVQPLPVPVRVEDEAGLPEYRDDSYAIVIGVDYAERKDIPSLKYAASDAQQVYDVLTSRKYGGINPENATLLLNAKATRNNIIAALRKIRTWDGYIYVFYSGHGAPLTEGESMRDAVIVPIDAVIADPDSLGETAIRLSYIQDIIDSSRAKGVMVALDACFTGGGKSIVAKGGKPIVGMMVSTELMKTTGKGKVIITSSAGNQQSWEDDSELKSGIFSHYFIEGMKGAAGDSVWVKVNELANYIKDLVPKATLRLKGQEQQPQVIGDGNFDVSRNWEKSKVFDSEMTKKKLRSAFEKGFISAGQLGKALDAINKKATSKLLDAFLNGDIDDKTFGELY